MKKLLKILLLKVSNLLKLGLIDESTLWFAPPLDHRLQTLKTISLKCAHKIPLYAKAQHGDEFKNYVRRKIAKEFRDGIMPYIKITIFENTYTEEINVLSELIILEDENRT